MDRPHAPFEGKVDMLEVLPRPSTSPVWVTQRRRCYVQLPRLDLETWVILRHPASRRIFLGAATSDPESLDLISAPFFVFQDFLRFFFVVVINGFCRSRGSPGVTASADGSFFQLPSTPIRWKTYIQEPTLQSVVRNRTRMTAARHAGADAHEILAFHAPIGAGRGRSREGSPPRSLGDDLARRLKKVREG